MITTRDRLLSAWESSVGLVRSFREYAHEIDDRDEIAQMFEQFALDEGLHASKVQELLAEYDK